ncbi:hypothetical protein HYY75_01225, partial [bacterium]|nr:hypothetical protein [bacterium]
TPPVMLIPLLILSVGALSAGCLGYPEGTGAIYEYLGSVIKQPIHAEHPPTIYWIVTILPGLLGIGLALLFYVPGKSPEPLVSKVFGFLADLFVHKLYLDELYEAFVVQPIKMLAQFCSQIGDMFILDGFLHSWREVFVFWGKAMRRLHSGQIQASLASFLAGVFILLSYILIRGGTWN